MIYWKKNLSKVHDDTILNHSSSSNNKQKKKKISFDFTNSINGHMALCLSRITKCRFFVFLFTNFFNMMFSFNIKKTFMFRSIDVSNWIIDSYTNVECVYSLLSSPFFSSKKKSNNQIANLFLIRSIINWCLFFSSLDHFAICIIKSYVYYI